MYFKCSVLAQEIQHNIGSMRAQSEKALQSAKEELSGLGSPSDFERNYQTEFDDIVRVRSAFEIPAAYMISNELVIHRI